MTSEILLRELQEYTSAQTVHMYIIERKLKAQAKTKDKPSLKFEYIPLQVNVSKELMPIISGMLSKAIEKKVKDDLEIKEYEVIDDTVEKLYVYNDLGKIEGFQEFLKNRLGGEIKPLQSFGELEELEKAWALCYGFYDDNNKKWLYCIKKLSPRRIAIETQTSQTVGEAVKNGIYSYFDQKTKTLKPFNGFSLNIEPSIDMIYVDEKIYIFQKKAFEDITSLTEEFEVMANDLITEIEDVEFIEGLAHLSNVIMKKPSFRQKLIKAKTIGNLDFLKTCTNIKREFQRAGKKLEIKFTFDVADKIVAETEDEAENIIKVLSEYYKEGIFGGKIFESPAGRVKK